MSNLFRVREIKPNSVIGQIAKGLILEPSGTAPIPVQSTFNATPNNPSISTPDSTIVDATDISPAATRPGIISFVENYNSWAQSPVLNGILQEKIPFIYLKESRLTNSTLFEQFKYFQHYKFIGRVEDVIGDVVGEDTLLTEFIERTADNLGIAFEVIETAADWIANIELPDLSQQFKKDPYEGIYSLKSTGFEYILPFYVEDVFQKTSMYDDTYSGDGAGNQIKSFEEIDINTKQRSQGIRALVEPGLYIEKPKFYAFGQNRESIQFSFPLLNTQSPEQIQQNYQFLFLLLFQNSMFRKDRAAFIPPCIYEVLVPGIRYMKHAFVSTLKVDFLGTRRVMEIGVPNVSLSNQNEIIGRTISTRVIIPEVYNVTMELETLHEETGNFLRRAAANTFEEVELLTEGEVSR